MREQAGVDSDLRIGIIGCGALGLIHAQRFSTIPGVRVAALADTNSAAIESTRNALAVPPDVSAGDYREILDSDLDAVCIATPDSLHVPQVLDAVAANLHVFCEKPLTLNAGDLDAVIYSREEVDRQVAMTYPRRYDPSIRAMRREIRSGRWGRVTMASAYDCEDWITPNRGTWRHDPNMCPGGFLYDANGHQLDTLFWATGLQGRKVRAYVDNRNTPVPITSWGVASLTDEVPFTFCFVGDARRWREQINIHCEGMDFVLQNGQALWIQDGELAPVPADEPEESGEEAFIRLIRGEGPNWAPPEDLWPVLGLTRAVLESAANREEVPISQAESAAS